VRAALSEGFAGLCESVVAALSALSALEERWGGVAVAAAFRQGQQLHPVMPQRCGDLAACGLLVGLWRARVLSLLWALQ